MSNLEPAIGMKYELLRYSHLGSWSSPYIRQVPLVLSICSTGLNKANSLRGEEIISPLCLLWRYRKGNLRTFPGGPSTSASEYPLYQHQHSVFHNNLRCSRFWEVTYRVRYPRKFSYFITRARHITTKSQRGRFSSRRRPRRDASALRIRISRGIGTNLRNRSRARQGFSLAL